MMEEKKYNEVNKVNEERAEKEKEQKHESKLTFDNSVVQKIAAIAVREIPGVLDMEGGFFSGIQETFGGYNATKGIDAEVGEKEAAIDVSVILEYGVSAVKVFQQLQEVVKQSVKKMTGLDVVEVNCKVVDVMTRKEFNLKNKKEEENKSGLK